MRKIGRRIRKARDERGMTQLMLAPLLGFTQQTSVSMVEGGHAPVTPGDLLRLSSIFDKPIWWFYDLSVRPTDLDDWLALGNNDRAWAQRHFELDQLEPSSRAEEA